MEHNNNDKEILRDLAKEVTEIAALPVQEEKRRLWRALNGLKPERPMVMIDQICWNEINVNDGLTLKCSDPVCRDFEFTLRSILFQWRNFPADMVVEPYICVNKAIYGSSLNVDVIEETVVTDETNSVIGHKYIDQFITEEDLEKIKLPHVYYDKAETERRLDEAADIFGDTISVYAEGYHPSLSVWDPISTWKSVERALYDMVDRPEYIHELVKKMTEFYSSLYDQLEDQGLLCSHQTLIHCTGAYTDELPKPGYDPKSPRLKDLWVMGLAQMFSTVSPQMHDEFELSYLNPLFERFGLVYYGCCDPLDKKMDIVRKIPNLRKVSMSPWVDIRLGAEGIGKDFVFSYKPNPAYLAAGSFDEDLIYRELNNVIDVCKVYDCPLELILKDISTVKYDPKRLFRWAEIAKDVANI